MHAAALMLRRISLSQPGCLLPVPNHHAMLCPARRSPACSTRASRPSTSPSPAASPRCPTSGTRCGSAWRARQPSVGAGCQGRVCTDAAITLCVALCAPWFSVESSTTVGGCCLAGCAGGHSGPCTIRLSLCVLLSAPCFSVVSAACSARAVREARTRRARPTAAFVPFHALPPRRLRPPGARPAVLPAAVWSDGAGARAGLHVSCAC